MFYISEYVSGIKNYSWFDYYNKVKKKKVSWNYIQCQKLREIFFLILAVIGMRI